jgi:hypothetical protein
MRGRGLSVIGVSASLAALALTALTAGAGASRNEGPLLTETMVNPAPSAVVADRMTWTVQVSGPAAKRLDFVIDGKVSSRLKVSSATGVRTYRYGASGLLDTRKLRNGSHRLKVTAYVKNGPAVSSEVPVTVDNEPAPPSGAPVLVNEPVIYGDALVGHTLTTTEGQWSGTAPITYAYQWLRCQPDCSLIGDGKTYTITADDVGSTLRSRVTATNADGSAAESSAPTAVVPAPAPEGTAPHLVSIPEVVGDALVGRTLTSSTGEWSGTTPMTFSFVWLRCHETSCTAVGDGPTYTVTGEDVGYVIRSRVTATNSAGAASESSAPTAVVAGSV